MTDEEKETSAFAKGYLIGMIFVLIIFVGSLYLIASEITSFFNHL